jgi:hypothetical protein
MANLFTRLFSRVQKAISESPPVKALDKVAIKRVGLAYTRAGGGNRKNFEASPYNFADILKAYNTDSFVRQAIDKYIELMFKAGWTITGPNEKAVDYVRQRLNWIAATTAIPTDQLFIEIAEDLVKYGNTFVIKARQKDGARVPPGLKAKPIGDRQPVSGYFVLPVSTIKIARDTSGTVLEYEQSVPGNSKKLPIRPGNMIHYYYKRDHGYAFGNPFVVPVLDDVRLLREIEENVARIIYRYAAPLYIYTVGMAQPGYEATKEELEYVQSMIDNMPTDGGLVVPERHKIEIAGARNEVMDFDKTLEYMRQRVFVGLGLPETVLGIGDTSNRGTSDNLSIEARDKIKAFQRVQEIFTDAFIINELLLEGGFDPITNHDDAVHFKFNEIDIDTKIALENATIQLWLNDLVTHDEARISIGRDPLDGDISMMRSALIKGATDSDSAEDKAADNKARPENQHGKKIGRKKVVKPAKQAASATATVSESVDELYSMLQAEQYIAQLDYHYSLTRQDTIDKITMLYDKRHDSDSCFDDFSAKDIELILRLTEQSVTDIMPKYVRPAIYEGAMQCAADIGEHTVPSIDIDATYQHIGDQLHDDVHRLMDDLANMILYSIRSAKQEDAVARMVGAFNALHYRLAFIARSQLMYAFNCGYALAGANAGIDSVRVIVERDTDCAECRTRASQPIALSGDIYNKIPPWHSNCACRLSLK